MAKGSASAEAKLVASLQAGKAKVQSLIKGDAADPKMATSEEARKGLYDGVLRMYEALTGGLAGTLNESYNETAQKAAVQAAKQIGEDALEVKFSKARLDNVLQIIHSGSVTDFCAVLTHKMGEQVVTALRAAVMEVLRRQAVEGLSAAEANKELQAAWARVANDANTYKFVDRGGRVWENARYFQMLVRTNQWRIWREIYLDTIASMGEDLVRISSDSGPEQCKVCKAWEGRILSVSGKDKRFPSYQDARAAGVFHPNCTHRLQAVLEGLTDDDLEEQAAENQARVDAGGSIGPTPPKPPKPGDYVPKKTHKKPKPAGPMPAKVEEEAAKKKAEDEQKAKKDAQAAKERVQALKDKGAALGAVEAALKASKANAIASLGAAKVAISESNNLFWGVDCEIPKSAYDAASNKAATPKDAQDAVKAAEAALDPVEKAGKEMVHAVAAAKAEDPATLEAAEKALAGYETALAEAKPKVEQAEKDAKAAEDACVKATEAIRAILEPLDKQAKAEKAAIDPKVKKLVVDIDAYRTGTETGLRDGSMTSGNVKDGFDNYTAKLADLKDEIAKATAVSKAISDGWAQKVAAMETDLGKIDTERKAYNNAGSKVSKAYNAVKKDVADAEAAWNAGDGKTALAKLLAAAKKEGTLDTNFNDAAFQQYQGLVASYTSKVQAVKAELARVQALVQGAAAVAPTKPIPTQTTPAAPVKLPSAKFPDALTMKQIEAATVNRNIGGTTGARLVEFDGQKFVCKIEGKVSAEHVKNEAAADQAYRAAGIRVPDCKVFTVDGKTVKLSQFIEGGKTLGDYLAKATPAQRKAVQDQLAAGFPLDALFANWDVVGTGQDNVLVDADGNVWRIDNGSSFGFRAQGARKKPEEWEKREWIDDAWSMRTAPINKDVFAHLSTGDVFRAARNIDFDSVVAGLPPDVQKAIAKPLAEMKQLVHRCDDNDRGGFTDEHTSAVLDESYAFCKTGVRERIRTMLSDAGVTHMSSTGDIPSMFRTGGAVVPKPTTWNPSKFSDAIIGAAKSINHHWTDKQVNAGKVQAALDLKSELTTLAATDKNAAKLLPYLEEIEQSQKSGWTKPVSKSVPSLTVAQPPLLITPAKPKPAGKRNLTAEVMDFVNRGGDPNATPNTTLWDFIARAQGAQSSSSWAGSAGKMKILSYEARGIEWDPQKTAEKKGEAVDGGAVFGRGSVEGTYKTCAEEYRLNPAAMDHDRQAFRAMKAALQVVYENLDIEGKTPEGDFLVCRMETNTRFVRNDCGISPGSFGTMPSAGCESTGQFESVFNGDMTVRRLPLSRMCGSYLLSRDGRGMEAFLGDGENEVTFDINGRDIPVFNFGSCRAHRDLKSIRAAFLKAEAAKKKGSTP